MENSRPKVFYKWIPHGRRRRGRPEQLRKEPSDELDEKQRHGSNYDRRIHLSCVDSNNSIMELHLCNIDLRMESAH